MHALCKTNMAASIASRCVLSVPKFSSRALSANIVVTRNVFSRTIPVRRLYSGNSTVKTWAPLSKYALTGVLSTAIVGTATFVWVQEKLTVAADNGLQKSERPYYPPSKSIKSNTDDTGLKLTLYQYATCPFCCKLRAYLDYRGFSYDIIEVNSVRRNQIKWSKYKKVPILVVEGVGPNGYIQLNDSSVIISTLESFLVNRRETIETLQSYYPVMESKNDKGKIHQEYPNRYFIMYGENKPKGSAESRKEERKWRHWTDAVLVHTLSPNVYRTPSEALQAFRYFSEAGEWEKHFNGFERSLVIYMGAAVMFLVGKTLVKKYNLKKDVRESLYDVCNEWTKMVGKKAFLGGDEPNLSDLSVYGVLSSIEGCIAFQEALQNTKIEPWYNSMKASVSFHKGATIMSSFVHE